MITSGYTYTPLARKLGLKEGFSYLLYHEPDYYYELFGELPENLSLLNNRVMESADFIHMFLRTETELTTMVKQYQPVLKKTGSLWISWPKGSSKIKTDLKRDMIRSYVLSIGLVDVKVAAIDEDWSGLKFVYRLKDRNL